MFNPSCRETFGGAEVDLFNLAVKLAEYREYEVTFIVGDYGQADSEYYHGVIVKKLKYQNIVLYNKLIHKILRLIGLWKTLLFSGQDIFVTETASSLIGWMALICGKVRGKKVVFRLASDINTDIEYYKKFGRSFYYLYRYGLKNASAVISQSEKQKHELEKNCGIKSTIIKNGFYIKNDICIDNKEHILWVSRGIPIKRPELFIELAKRLPDEKFIIIMPRDKIFYKALNDEDSLGERLEKLMRPLDNIRHIEFVPFHEIHRYYEKAKLFVNTSEYEGFPNAFVQACLAKTPILSLKVNPDNFINKYQLGYVADESIDNAVGFIRNLKSDRLQEMGANAFDYIRKNHDINLIINEYRGLMDALG